jgi:hypothetical protein
MVNAAFSIAVASTKNKSGAAIDAGAGFASWKLKLVEARGSTLPAKLQLSATPAQKRLLALAALRSLLHRTLLGGHGLTLRDLLPLL